MHLVAREKNITIRHEMNAGVEKRIGPYFVDGYDPDNKHVYEVITKWMNIIFELTVHSLSILLLLF